MTDETNEMDVLTALSALETIEAEWAAFGRRAASLAARFGSVSDESDLQAAVAELVAACRDYPYLWLLLRQAGSKRPPAPAEPLQFNPQEIANRYHDLLVKLKPDQPQGNADDCRTDA